MCIFTQKAYMIDLLDKLLSKKYAAYALLAVIAFLLFYKSLHYDFSPMDEQWLIVKKINELKDPANLSSYFSTTVSGLYYRPLLNISFAINAMSGTLNPFGYHLTNVLLHLLCVFLLYRLLLLLEVKKPLAFLLSGLFAVHPVLLHAVVWVPGRNDSLLALFMLLAFITWAGYVQKGKIVYLALHLLCFAAALFTKENAIVFPLLFATLFWAYRGQKSKMIVPAIAWIVIAVGWYFLKTQATAFSLSQGKGFLITLSGCVKGLLIYTGKLLFPFQNSVAPTVKNSSLLPGIIVLAGLILLCLRPGFRNPRMAMLGAVVFLVPLLIPAWYGASSPIGEQYEHRMYCSVIGFIILVSQLKAEAFYKPYAYVLLSLSLVFAAVSFVRMGVYKNEMSYLNEGIKDCPENYVFHFQKANTLYKEQKFSESVACYSEALKLHPTREQLLVNRGNAYLAMNMGKEAIADYNTAWNIHHDPQIILFRFGAYKQLGDLPNAMQDLQLIKQYFGNKVNAGISKEEIAAWNQERLNAINAMIAKEPNNALLYVNRAKVYMDLRNGKEALEDLRKACELEPQNAGYKRYFNELNSSLPKQVKGF